MIRLLKKQQGLTLISLTFVLTLAGAIFLLALTIIPIYLNHNKLTRSLADLKSTPDIESKNQAEIRDSLTKRLLMNNIDDVTQEDITITQYGDYFKVSVDYEVVKKIVGNLSVLVEFKDDIEVGNP